MRPEPIAAATERIDGEEQQQHHRADQLAGAGGHDRDILAELLRHIAELTARTFKRKKMR